jgi:prepilin-type N-terminal cleavage/methylation domain-containing protein
MTIRHQTSDVRLQQSGFTFVELVIAATILAILTVGIATHLRGGVVVWRRATQVTEALQRQRVALERLERDLANAIVYDVRADDDVYGPQEGALPWPQFTGDVLGWYTVAPPGRDAGGVRHVTYTCAEVEGVTGLWRTAQTLGAARRRQSAPAPQLLLPGCETLRAQFGYQPAEGGIELEWLARWDDPLTLPRLMEVSLDLDSGATLTRVLSAGSGVLPPVETGAGP